MARFHTSDTHMGHARIAEFVGRPWLGQPIEAMNEALIAAWNAVVSPADEVIHYGDLALGVLTDSLAAVARLNGRKFLIPGNHDRVFSGNPQRDRFRAAYEDAGFTILPEQIDLTLRDEVTGETIPALGCHFPYLGDSHDTDRYATLRPLDAGLPLVHGHVHEKWLVATSLVSGARMVNVGVDAPGVGFRPLAEQTVVDLLLGRITTL